MWCEFSLSSGAGSKKDVILSFDIGTTKVKAALVDAKTLRTVDKVGERSTVRYPQKGWAEQDPEELWNQIARLSSKLQKEKYNIRAIAFSAYLAGVVPVDLQGNPLMNMIIWIDERAAGLPKEIWNGPIKFAGYNLFRLLEFAKITGGAPGYSGKDPISKITWIRDFEPEVFRGVWKFLSVTGYLVFKATGIATMSPDDASLTWLADTRNGKASWHRGLLRRYKIPEERLPPIRDSIEIAGTLSKKSAKELNVEREVPVVVGAGDLTAAAIGSGAVKEGEMHIYIGTSNWIGAHISKRTLDISTYIGSIMSAIPKRYLLVAEQEVAAGALEWFMRTLGLENKYDIVEEEVKDSPPGSRDLIFTPWMYGERAPIDDPNARGILFNLDLSHKRKDILRAIMEGITFNIRWVYEPMERLTYHHDFVKVVGGGVLFNEWCRILASIINRKIARVMDPQDATLRGVSIVALLGLGYYKSFEQASELIRVDKVFEPNKSWNKIYDEMFYSYKELYKKLRKLFKDLNEKHSEPKG